MMIVNFQCLFGNRNCSHSKFSLCFVPQSLRGYANPGLIQPTLRHKENNLLKHTHIKYRNKVKFAFIAVCTKNTTFRTFFFFFKNLIDPRSSTSPRFDQKILFENQIPIGIEEPSCGERKKQKVSGGTREKLQSSIYNGLIYRSRISRAMQLLRRRRRQGLYYESWTTPPRNMVACKPPPAISRKSDMFPAPRVSINCSLFFYWLRLVFFFFFHLFSRS